MNADDMGSGKARNELPFQKAAAFSSIEIPFKKGSGGNGENIFQEVLEQWVYKTD